MFTFFKVTKGKEAGSFHAFVILIADFSVNILYTCRGSKLGHFQKDKLTQTKEATIYSEFATFLVMEGENK